MEVSPRESVVQSACQYAVTSRVSDFQNGEQSVYRRDGQKFRFYHGNTVPISWIWRFLGSYYHRKLDLSTNRRFVKGCITLYIVRIFSTSELVEPHIIPLKVRLAIALKEEAK